MSFTHLHLASGYSFKYGTTLPDSLVERAAELGMSALALTDRDTLAGAIRFVTSCDERSIAPVLGIDIAFLNEKRRITLLATPGKGWNSLVNIMTALKEEPSQRCTIDFLRRNSHHAINLLALHGAESEMGYLVGTHRYKQARTHYDELREIFLDQAIECVSHFVYGDGSYSTTHEIGRAHV